MEENTSQVILYQSEDGEAHLQVRLEGETVWLTQVQLTELFGKAKSTISEHISRIFEEGELQEAATVRKFRTVQTEGEREVEREIYYYNLDVIISVGYRVRSQRGTQFRIWATQRLREYLVKGFTLDDNRLKEQGFTNRYFEELLARVRDIRTSEKNFYYKVREIFATSEDYDADSDISHEFFATVQNKFHWAIHHHTAAELIHARANATRPNMGLTNFPGNRVIKKDVTIAKNYLTTEELQALNLLVEQYLSFAESQALARKPMRMVDWMKKLHDILTINDRQVLLDAGRISKAAADKKAETEYQKWRHLEDRKSIEALKQLTEKAGKLNSAPKTKKP